MVRLCHRPGERAFVVRTAARPGEGRYAEWKSIVDVAKDTLRFR